MMTVNAPITSGQRKQIVRFVEDGLDALGLTKHGAQRVIEQGDTLQEQFQELIRELAVSNCYADEEVASDYGYPSTYAVKPLEAQIATLKRHFPQLRSAYAVAFMEEALPALTLPEGAEGWFAIPRWEKIAPTYGEPVEKMLAVISSTRKFHNYRKGELGTKYLRQHECSIQAWKKLSEQQPGDILIVPAQFGKRHAGRSVRRAREIFTGNEFGLGSFAVGMMLLTHPERLVAYENLWLDCSGDEYAPVAGGVFSGAPCFCFGFDDGVLRFDAYGVDRASDGCGSASGFLPN